jgi:hypothetical protein
VLTFITRDHNAFVRGTRLDLSFSDKSVADFPGIPRFELTILSSSLTVNKETQSDEEDLNSMYTVN